MVSRTSALIDRLSNEYAKWVLFLPGFILFLSIVVGPLAFNNILMFLEWNIVDPFKRGISFAGLENFRFVLFEDPRFWNAMQVTALFTVAAVPAEFLLGLGLALVLQRETRLLRSIRALYLLPIMMAPVATGTIWRMMYNFDYGVVNYFLRFLGIPPQLWVSSASQSLLSTVIVDVWMWTPFMALVLLSGLQALDREPFEAAAVDGASSWQLFRNLTFPMMKPFILIAVTIRTMDAMKLYDILYTLTYGGPGYSTSSATWQIAKTAFRGWYMGRAAAESFFLFVAIMLASTLFIRALRVTR